MHMHFIESNACEDERRNRQTKQYSNTDKNYSRCCPVRSRVMKLLHLYKLRFDSDVKYLFRQCNAVRKIYEIYHGNQLLINYKTL